ncbi:MAG: hypothetical protein IT425_13370 [Pirellulales bacterium]|nr:hypothetical protein [Pirellulales bacterium]
MMRFLGWQYWLPRGLTVAVIALAAHVALGLVARSALMRSMSDYLGSQVRVGYSRVVPWEHRVVFKNLQVADPDQRNQAILEADCCELLVSPEPLLHKQLVVQTGRLTGIHFAPLDHSRVEKQATNPKSASLTDGSMGEKWFPGYGREANTRWLAQLSTRLQKDTTARLASVQRVEAVAASWSRQSAELDQQSEQLSLETKKLEEAYAAAEANPLRNDEFLNAIPRTISELQAQCMALAKKLETLPEKLEAERRSVIAARREDEQSAKSQLLIAPIDSQNLSGYLLADSAARSLDDLAAIVQGLRESSKNRSLAPAAHKRGVDVLFAGCKPESDWVIENLELQGTARIAGQPTEWQGVLRDFSSSPALHRKTLQLRLRAAGPVPLELFTTIDRTGQAPRDTIVLDCQGIRLPELALGNTQELAVSVGPSVGTLSASIVVEGEKLSGEIQLVQRNVRLLPTMGNKLADEAIASSLEESLARVDSLATRITLGGTLTQPRCTVWSTLGPAVAEAIQHAAGKAGNEHRRALLVEAGKQVDERLTLIERQMTDLQSSHQSRIADLAARLQPLASSAVPRDRLSPERLGRRLPNNSLFR